MIDNTLKGLFLKVFIGLLLFSIVSSAFYSYYFLNKQNSVTAKTLEIKEGTTLTGVVRQLYEKGVVSDLLTTRILLQALGFQRNLRAGVYDIRPGETLLELISKISEGKEKLFSFTIVEGRSFKALIKNIENTQSIASEDISDLSWHELSTALAIEASSPEGLFFPDTYHYPWGITAFSLLKMSKRKMDEIIEEEWKDRNSNLTFSSKYEALVLASIIEKETANPSERTMISGVFNNRLSKRMRLQSDPTVIYGLGDLYKGNIKKIHLKQWTPYNTYKIKGLPPTPIAMPGRHSIRAALQPKKTDALYFVSKGDGSHIFSSSLKDHNKAVNRYQKNNNGLR